MKRYPLQDLIDAVGLTNSGLTTAELCRRLGMPRNTFDRAKKQGLSEVLADRYAVGLGFVPWLVWPEWIDDVIADVSVECAADGCEVRFIPTRKNHRCCSDRCSKLHHKRTRYRTDREVAAAVREQRRAHYAECAEYERAASRENHRRNRDRRVARMRAYYQENADELKAKQRARYAAKKAAA